jgi:hypothetical protein
MVLQDNVTGQPATSRSPANEPSLLGDVTRCQEAIQGTLMALRAGSTRREVERRGVLGELLDHLATMTRLIGPDGLVGKELELRICGCLERVQHLLPADTKASLDRETARELPTELRCILLEVAASTGRLDYLETRLEEEQRREQLEVSMLRWSDLLDPGELAVLRDGLARADTGTPQKGSDRIAHRAVETLATLYQARNHADRDQRAHDRVRDARLQWVTRWLLQLLVLAGALLVVAFGLAGSARQGGWLDDAVRVVLVIVVGGLGGALSGTRRLLGVPLLRGQLDRFQAAFRGQVVVGGTLGLVALLLFEAGSLPTFPATSGVPNIVPIAIYAFVAGFSEPFALGVVQGLIGGRNTPSLSGQDGSPDHNR